MNQDEVFERDPWESPDDDNDDGLGPAADDDVDFDSDFEEETYDEDESESSTDSSFAAEAKSDAESHFSLDDIFIDKEIEAFRNSISHFPDEEIIELSSQKRVVLSTQKELSETHAKYENMISQQKEAQSRLDEASVSGVATVAASRRKELSTISAEVARLESEEDKITERLQLNEVTFEISYLRARVNYWISEVDQLNALADDNLLDRLRSDFNSFMNTAKHIDTDISDHLQSFRTVLENLEPSDDACTPLNNMIQSYENLDSEAEEINKTLKEKGAEFKDKFDEFTVNHKKEREAMQQVSLSNDALAVLFSSMTSQISDLKNAFNELKSVQRESQKQTDLLLDKIVTLNTNILNMKATLQDSDISQLSSQISNATANQIDNHSEKLAEKIGEKINESLSGNIKSLVDVSEELSKTKKDFAESANKFETSSADLNKFAEGGEKAVNEIKANAVKILDDISREFEETNKKKINDLVKFTYAKAGEVINKWFNHYGIITPDSVKQVFFSPIFLIGLFNLFFVAIIFVKMFFVH